MTYKSHGSTVVRLPSKAWQCPGKLNQRAFLRTIDEVWHTYANLVDYVRLALSFSTIVFVVYEQPIGAAFAVMLSYILDWVDGPLARKFDQCSYLGASLDWLADVLTNVGQIYWWSTLGPWSCMLFGWPFLFAELSYMMFDTICYSSGRYPQIFVGTVAKDLGPLLTWSLRPGTHGCLYMYTDFYAFIWILFPITTCTLCLEWSLLADWSAAPLLVQGWLWLTYTVGVFFSAIFVMTEVNLAFLLLRSWTEDREVRGATVVYDDAKWSSGGCTVFTTKTSMPEMTKVAELRTFVETTFCVKAAACATMSTVEDVWSFLDTHCGSRVAPGGAVRLTSTLFVVSRGSVPFESDVTYASESFAHVRVRVTAPAVARFLTESLLHNRCGVERGPCDPVFLLKADQQ